MTKRQLAWSMGKNAFAIEAKALECTGEELSEEAFLKAVQLLAGAERIAASGCGHSGIACRHFAHLMCCIQRPACFLCPSEATHGSSGFLAKNDVLLLASRGGKTAELLPIAEIAQKKGVRIIVVTENTASPLAQSADVVLQICIQRETDRYNSQGTTSFAVLNAIFDALQSALIEIMDFQNEDFALIHPGGAVGQRLNST